MQVNSIWIIDQDYSWDNDSVKFAYINMSKETQVIEAWTRIGQGMFLAIAKPEFEVVETMWDKESRGWFWTTWIK